MALIHTQTAVNVEVVVDTEKFSHEDWKRFVLANVPAREIRRVAQSEELFPFSKLKEIAIRRAQSDPKDF